jgi:3-oxoacyl-[acyl-carrier protein] reductase
MTQKLSNQNVLVVGAAGGIGAAVVETLAARGVNVVGADILKPTSKKSVSNLICDVTDANSVNNLVAQSISELGSLTGVAYISGVLHPATSIVDFEIASWERVFDVNVKGIIRLAHKVIPEFKKNSGGSFVSIASTWGHEGHAYFSAYCASKAAVISLSQSMADEFARDLIRFNTVAPGSTDTQMHRDALTSEAAKRGISFDEMRSIDWGKIPMGFAAPPSSIADSVAFLLSSESSYITGATIDVNGGMLFH